VGFAFLLLQGVSETIKRLYWAMGWEEPQRIVHEVH
jgi:TRAP-type mannitol/chloroaromatic compound transport system permease small subunit